MVVFWGVSILIFAVLTERNVFFSSQALIVKKGRLLKSINTIKLITEIAMGISALFSKEIFAWLYKPAVNQKVSVFAITYTSAITKARSLHNFELTPLENQKLVII